MIDEKFEKIYNELITKNKSELERYRKSTQKEMIYRILTIILAFLVALALIYIFFRFAFKSLGIFEIIFMFLFIIIFGFLIIWINKKFSSKFYGYKKMYKDNIIYPLIKSFGQDYIYNPNLRYKFRNL